MSFKNPKNLIVVVSVVAALMAGTILLGGYANSKSADTVQTASGCSGTPCTTGCPKPCCVGENAEGCCDNPCPIPCPKPCCAEEGCCGTAEKTGCCSMTATETAAR